MLFLELHQLTVAAEHQVRFHLYKANESPVHVISYTFHQNMLGDRVSHHNELNFSRHKVASKRKRLQFRRLLGFLELSSRST